MQSVVSVSLMVLVFGVRVFHVTYIFFVLPSFILCVPSIGVISQHTSHISKLVSITYSRSQSQTQPHTIQQHMM